MSSKNGWSRRTLPITDVKLVIMVDAELQVAVDEIEFSAHGDLPADGGCVDAGTLARGRGRAVAEAVL